LDAFRPRRCCAVVADEAAALAEHGFSYGELEIDLAKLRRKKGGGG
jgi:hypothetical protein